MAARVVLRPHAPLMWVLLPILVGYGIAEPWGAGVKENFLWLGLLSAISFFGATYFSHQKTFRSKIYLSIGIVALSIVYYACREERPPVPPEQKAPREATLIIEPRQSFALKRSSGREAGIGIIREGPVELIGEKINYSVWWNLREPLDAGAQIKMSGVLSPNKIDEKTSGGFDEFLDRMHVPWSLSRGDAKEIVKPSPAFWHGITQLHKGAIAILHRRWKMSDDPASDTGLLPAIVLGDKAELTPQQKENFIKSGTMHLIAVSGMNVMAVAIVLWVLARLTGLPRVWQAALVVAALGLYSLVAGAGPSVLRAWGLVSLGLAAWALGRQRNLWATLGLAATVSLVISPLSFLHAGWRMSFAVVSGVVLAMGAIERWGILRRMRGRVLRRLRPVAETLVVSFVAGLCVLPMSVSYWGMWQPFGFTVNAVAVALASIVTVLGTLSWLVAGSPARRSSSMSWRIFSWGLSRGRSTPT